MKPNIELHIEELVLHGFAPGDRTAIGAAVEQELARLLATQNVSSSLMQSREAPVFDGGSFQVASGSMSETLGTLVAQSVHEGLNR